MLLLPLPRPIYVDDADDDLHGESSCHIDGYIQWGACARGNQFLVELIEAPDCECGHQRE